MRLIKMDRQAQVKDQLNQQLDKLKLKPASSKETADLYRNVALNYAELNEFENELRYQLESLKAYQTEYPGDHVEIANALDYIAVAYSNLGDPQNSLNYNLKALEMRQKLFDGNHADIAHSLSTIGSVYR